MPTPQVLAFRVVSHPSGASAISMALPDYAPGYQWDDWFYVALMLDGTVTAEVTGTPWVTDGTPSDSLRSVRFYDNDDTPWSAESGGLDSWSALAVMIAFRNGGRVTNYAIGGGTIGGTPALKFTRDVVPALPQDAVGVLSGLASVSDGEGGMESVSPLMTDVVIYRADEVATTVYNDATRWAMWTGVAPEGSTFPADVPDPGGPFDAANWGTDARMVAAAYHPVRWDWIDYAPNPVVEPPPPPPPPVPACPDHLPALAQLIPAGVRVTTESPVVIRCPVVSVRPTART